MNARIFAAAFAEAAVRFARTDCGQKLLQRLHCHESRLG